MMLERRPAARGRVSPAPPAPAPSLARLCRSLAVRALWAFGSRQREARRLLAGARARGPSDLDLGVLFAPPWADTFQREARLEAAVEALVRGVRVDVVPLHRAGALFRARAVAGERLWAADRREAEIYEESAWAMAADLAPIERWRQAEEIRLVFEAAATAAAARERG